jgi:phage host-nuclease inhibitor protein Gam
MSYSEELKQLDAEVKKQQASQQIAYAKSQQQMKSAIEVLDYSDKQLANLLDAVTEIIADREKAKEQQVIAQTYKAKIVNLACELGMSVDEVYTHLNKSK